ncbi:MAG: M20/M25/M40 family metallo-hydrolase [Candidatus Caldarchaeum sp.]|nr:M20/M25/M40 family metallo-hydrolase [Candidatus Caldarchaeum sp.]MDW8063800.1 M20/M25/M40 family metallo-hydrolase [Candidatus Caldarchaeum sp.]
MDFLAGLVAGLVGINSENPPGREGDAARFFAEKAAENGLKAKVVDHGGGRASALVEVDFGMGPVVVFNSHLDTVPAGPLERWSFHPFTAGVRGGFVLGRGSVDAKGCLAAMLNGLVSLKNERLSGKVVLMAVADEEVGGMGSLVLMKMLERMDYVVVGEPTSLNLCVASRGRTEVTMNFLGRPAHASMPLQGRNAAAAAAKAVVKLSKLERGYGTKGRLVGRNSAVVTVFESGLKPNVVPDAAKVVVDVRTIDESPLTTLSFLKRYVRTVIPAGVGFKAFVSSSIPYYRSDVDGKLVKVCRQALQEAGVEPVLKGFPAATDLNRMNRVKKVDGVILGPGDLRLAHSFSEKVSLKELSKASVVYKLIAEKLLD